MFGFLNIDKPPGITSRDVVNRVQHLVKPEKTGHAGTLDPLATGVLVVGIGAATRLVEYVQRMPKTYEAKFLLGRTSDTEDVEGVVVELTDPPVLTEASLRDTLGRFIGVIEQQPPVYSALKVAGRPAYKLARRGETVELQPRQVEIFELQLLRYDYPELELFVRCGSGTYVRSLGRDLARQLGTDAVMVALRRTAIGSFQADDAIRFDELSRDTIQQRLLPATHAFGDLPRIEVTEPEAVRLLRGQAIANRWRTKSNEVAALDWHGRLVAILVSATDEMLRPSKCFPAE